jgi:hypothetical protein
MFQLITEKETGSSELAMQLSSSPGEKMIASHHFAFICEY